MWGRPGYRIWDLLLTFITRQTAACSGQSGAGRTDSIFTEEDAEFPTFNYLLRTIKVGYNGEKVSARVWILVSCQRLRTAGL